MDTGRNSLEDWLLLLERCAILLPIVSSGRQDNHHRSYFTNGFTGLPLEAHP